MRTLSWAALAAALALTYSAAAQGDKTEEGFVPLFDGKTLTGWNIENKGKFSVKDGAIFLDKGSGWLRSDKEYKDFELRMDFRFVSPKADSGVFVRASKDGKNWPAKNYQIQTMDNDSIGEIFPAMLAKPKKVLRDPTRLREVRKKTGAWQTYAITVKGGDLEVKLNDVIITTAAALAPEGGYIGLQGEGGQLEFKNIRIKELK